MTKPRPPLSFAQGVTKIAGQIGWAEAGKIVGKSDRLVRLWSEPDRSDCPTLDQALALDAAFCAAGGDGAPLLDAYAMQLSVHVQDEIACHLALADAAAKAVRECGDAVAAAIAVIQPGADVSVIHRAIAEGMDGVEALQAMLRHLKSFLPAGAGPVAGMTGGAR